MRDLINLSPLLTRLWPVLCLCASSAFAAEPVPAPKTKKVELVSPQLQDWSTQAIAYARISAPYSSQFLAPDQCQVKDVFVSLGEEVKAGQPLYQLNCPSLTLAMRATQTQLAQAQTQYQRLKTLQQRQAVDDSQVELQALLVEQSKATLASLELQLSQAQAIAPQAGQISQITLSPNQQVQAGDALLSLSTPEHQRLSLAFDSTLPINRGEFINLASTQRSSATLRVPVAHISQIQSAEQTQSVEVTLPRPSPFKAGEYVRAEWKGKPVAQLTLPEIAVVLSGSEHYVWAVRDGKAKKLFVKVLQRQKGLVAVESADLTLKDKVVSEGAWLIKSNQALSAKNKQSQ